MNLMTAKANPTKTLEQLYKMLISQYPGSVVTRPDRIKIFDPGAWCWKAKTFTQRLIFYMAPKFESLGIGEMFCLTIHTQPNTNLFLAIRYYRHSKDEILSIWETNSIDFVKKQRKRFFPEDSED